MADTEATLSPRDPLYQPFYDGLEASEIRFPKCGHCGKFHWYPMPLCPHCQSDSLNWTKVRGLATIFTWTLVHHTFDKSFYLSTPYAVALLEFDDAPGVRLVANLSETDPERLKVGLTVKPVFVSSAGEARVIFNAA